MLCSLVIMIFKQCIQCISVASYMIWTIANNIDKKYYFNISLYVIHKNIEYNLKMISVAQNVITLL